MKKLDLFIQKLRIKEAEKYIIGNSILDIGCHQGELFNHLLKRKEITGDGIDTVLTKTVTTEKYNLFPGYFPKDFKLQKQYDTTTFLAVLEHIPIEEIKKYPDILSNFLLPKARVIITIPSKKVDYILNVLLFFRLIKGMDLEHHQDFDRSLLKDIFISGGYKLIIEKKFELGLNNLYVFEKE